MPGELHFNGFEMNTPSHINHGLWRAPGNQRHRYKDLDYWQETAQLLERGLFDAVFLADVLGTYEVYRGSHRPAIERGLQIPNNDPFLLVPAMAAATAELGFVVTSLTTYDQPFPNARRFSTLDHLSRGRVGWNVVTGYLPGAAQNYGLADQLRHDDRYEIADEYLEVSYRLWEESWDEDAVVRDASANRYSDPDRVHTIDHAGQHFSVRGPHLSEPSRQRTPVIYQAGSSERGRLFAATHAEGVFVGGRTIEQSAEIVEHTKEIAESRGRKPGAMRFLGGVNIITAETQREVRAKTEELFAHRDIHGYLAHFGGSSGIDIAALGADDYLEYRARDRVQSAEKAFAEKRVSSVIDFYEDPRSDPFTVIGTPDEVADQLEQLAADAHLDGFNIVQYTSPGTFADVVELIVPELQRRGRYRTHYEPGATLRERLGTGDGPRLSGSHPGRESAVPSGRP